MQPHSMMSGGERRPVSDRSGAWITDVMKAAAAGGLKRLVLRSRALRILPPDSPVGMTGEPRADLVGGCSVATPKSTYTLL